MTVPLGVGRVGIKLLATEDGGWEATGIDGEELEVAVGRAAGAGEGVGAGEGKSSCPEEEGGSGGGEGDCLPSNFAVLLETNQALTTFSVRFKLAAKALRSESIGYSSLLKVASKVDSVIGSRVDFDSMNASFSGSFAATPADFGSCFETFFLVKFLLDGLLLPTFLFASLLRTFSTLTSILTFLRMSWTF